MATIYIVEDDINIREIERYALKTAVMKWKNLRAAHHFLSVWKKISHP